MALTTWNWTRGDEYQSHFAAARGHPRSLVFKLPTGNCPPAVAFLSGVLRTRLETIPEPLRSDTEKIPGALVHAFEELQCIYSGADLDAAFLLEVAKFTIHGECGFKMHHRAVLAWAPGIFGVLSTCEIPICEEFYADRILFIVELRNGCELGD